MRFECVQFWSTRANVSDKAVRDNLPAHLREELIKDAYGIQVEASKREVIQAIEKFLRIGKTRDFVRHEYLEVDRKEIGDYSHFFIRPRRFGWKEQVFFEVTERCCKSEETCWRGVKTSSPVRLRAAKLKGIGEIVGPPIPQTKRLLITPRVRELFDSEGVTGLEYERCEDLDGASDAPFVATVLHGAYEAGTDIVAKPCPEHGTIAGCCVFDPRIPRLGLSRDDLQMIDRVTVKNRDYFHWYPSLVVSQRALRLLLKHKIPTLQRVTRTLNQKFRPLIVS
jgi:hypothetical protein